MSRKWRVEERRKEEENCNLEERDHELDDGEEDGEERGSGGGQLYCLTPWPGGGRLSCQQYWAPLTPLYRGR